MTSTIGNLHRGRPRASIDDVAVQLPCHQILMCVLPCCSRSPPWNRLDRAPVLLGDCLGGIRDLTSHVGNPSTRTLSLSSGCVSIRGVNVASSIGNPSVRTLVHPVWNWPCRRLLAPVDDFCRCRSPTVLASSIGIPSARTAWPSISGMVTSISLLVESSAHGCVCLHFRPGLYLELQMVASWPRIRCC